MAKNKTQSAEINTDPNSKYEPLPLMEINNPEVIKCFIHKKQSKILEILIIDAKTIMEISTELDWNPGTVKRHLENLMEYNLVQFSHSIKNKFNITMKFYRTTAKRFHFDWSWPN